MKNWLKWLIAGLVVLLVASATLRTFLARQTQNQALVRQQEAQKIQVPIDLTAADLVQVKTIALGQGLAISGPIRAVNSAVVKARVAGELQGLTVREGDFVKAGQVIARIEATEFQARVQQARQQAQSAQAQVDIAKRSFDNNKALVDQGFISKTALETSQASLAAAESTYRAAQAGADIAAKSLDDTVLRAPMAGQIAQRLAQPGERVAVDARIVDIVDLSRLELEASLSAADSLQVKVGQLAQLTVEGAAQPLAARVVRVNPTAVAGSRAVLAYLALDGNANLRQGLFAQGTLQTGSLRTLAAPLSAVHTDKPQPYVQLLSKGVVLHQTVEVGERGEFNGQTQVAIKGLNEGDTILSGTVGTLRAGTPVKLPPQAK